LPPIVVNVVPKLVPTVVAAVMIATAMSAAIRPYSMAVAPDSSAKSFLKNRHGLLVSWTGW
jgi:hypothetical protein